MFSRLKSPDIKKHSLGIWTQPGQAIGTDDRELIYHLLLVGGRLRLQLCRRSLEGDGLVLNKSINLRDYRSRSIRPVRRHRRERHSFGLGGPENNQGCQQRHHTCSTSFNQVSVTKGSSILLWKINSLT